ncbi:MAG: hypothetical protein ACPH63_08195 [Flavobacteriaceae bacterium]
MKIVFLSFLFTLNSFSSPPQDNCKNRLSYLHFDVMTPKQRLLWLNCAFEKLKDGDDSYIKKYTFWQGNAPDYKSFLKAYARLLKEKN